MFAVLLATARLAAPTPVVAPATTLALAPTAILSASPALTPFALSPALAPAAASVPQPLTQLTAAALPGEDGDAGAKAAVVFDGLKGERLAADLLALRDAEVGRIVPLDYAPTKGSVKALGKLEGFEAALARRFDGGWELIRGRTESVPVERGKYDLMFHNHYYHPIYAKSFTPYPSDGDLVHSAGQTGRFFVASASGLVEWSPKVPLHPVGRRRMDEAKKAEMLDPAVHDLARWRRTLRWGSFWRVASELLPTVFYPRILRLSGVELKFYRWSSKILDQAFFSRGPSG